MESFGEVSCSFRIQVGTEASAYDAGENVNQNSGDIIFSAKSALMLLAQKGRFFTFTPGFSRVIGNGSRE